jgi:hypothetical protein
VTQTKDAHAMVAMVNFIGIALNAVNEIYSNDYILLTKKIIIIFNFKAPKVSFNETCDEEEVISCRDGLSCIENRCQCCCNMYWLSDKCSIYS